MQTPEAGRQGENTDALAGFEFLLRVVSSPTTTPTFNQYRELLYRVVAALFHH